MKESDPNSERESQTHFEVRSPHNQFALCSTLLLHMYTLQTFPGQEPQQTSEQLAVGFEVAKKLVGGFAKHHTETSFQPPNLLMWAVLGMGDSDVGELPAYSTCEETNTVSIGPPFPDLATFETKPEVELLFDACDGYLTEATNHVDGGRHLHVDVVEQVILPIRSLICGLAAAHGREVSDEQKTRWGILPEYELNDADQEFLTEIEFRQPPQ